MYHLYFIEMRENMQNILVIGIAGGSGSGKTTLADRIIEHFGNAISIVHHDNYYRAYPHLTYEEREKINFDHPDSFETERMVADIRKLKDGMSIECPVYDYTVHNRKTETMTIEPRPIILIEGILIFVDTRLCDLMDIKIFVDTDADIRLIRRIHRDMKTRSRTLESILTQYMETVKPMHDAFVAPSKRKADIVVQEGGKNVVAFDMIVNRLEAHIAGHLDVEESN